MNAVQFQNAVVASFSKYFPCGFANVSSFALGGGVCFRFGLIERIVDCTNNIRDNDPLTIMFGIHERIKFNSETELHDKLEVEFIKSSFCVLPKNKYMAMGSERIAARKINNTPEKILINIDKYFAKAQAQIKENINNNNLYNQDKIPEKYLKF